jgi:hypothetical protein
MVKATANIIALPLINKGGGLGLSLSECAY